MQKLDYSIPLSFSYHSLFQCSYIVYSFKVTRLRLRLHRLPLSYSCVRLLLLSDMRISSFARTIFRKQNKYTFDTKRKHTRRQVHRYLCCFVGRETHCENVVEQRKRRGNGSEPDAATTTIARKPHLCAGYYGSDVCVRTTPTIQGVSEIRFARVLWGEIR